jgi:hypothetical protein
MFELTTIETSHANRSVGSFGTVTAIAAITALLLTVQLVAVAKYPDAFDAAFGITAP